jgi:hypothetical protein
MQGKFLAVADKLGTVLDELDAEPQQAAHVQQRQPQPSRQETEELKGLLKNGLEQIREMDSKLYRQFGQQYRPVHRR